MQKKGVSEIVSYVLLISITFAIAGMVYAWLIFYVTPGKETKCDEGISLTIRSYKYNCTASGNPLNVTIQNRGLFNFDGYVVRLGTDKDSSIGIFILNKTGRGMSTGEVYSDYYKDSTRSDEIVKKTLSEKITFIEIQPYTNQSNLPVYCASVAKQKINCS